MFVLSRTSCEKEMKYGVLYNADNVNLGDDIQAYATARFLPSIDYFIDRENINKFCTDNNEPVAVIMNAWYMWEKWHWPPSRCIVPHMVGIHYADHELAVQPGSPLKYEALEGIGGDYLRAYQPIGCRDFFTMNQLNELGIDAYFSGCITLTLPQMLREKSQKEYICIVDCEEKVRKHLQTLLKDSGLEIKIITHNGTRDSERTWEERQEKVVELLTLYRNAKCVITKRLHCALPCLAQDTPVFLIKEMTEDIRFSPYYDLLHRTTVTEFMAGNYDYDFTNPPANKPDYKAIREKLEKSCVEFVNRMESETRSVEELDKFAVSDSDVHEWQYQLMDTTLNKWLKKTRIDFKTNNKLTKKVQQLEKEQKLLENKIKSLEKENEKLLKIVNSKTVRWARKLRKVLKG